MKLPFRQGIVDAQKNGLGQPQFILLSSTPGYLQLSATLSPTTIAVAHGGSDYLFTFNQNVDPAWGPMVPGVNNYLYWNVDVQTAAVTYGITTLEPIASPTEPVAPQVDQHWFDLSTTTMKVWTGAKWQVRVRLFAGMVPNGNLSGNPSTWCYPLYQPWVDAQQLQVDSNPGYIMTNIFGQPQYVSGTSLEFMTSKTPVRFNTTVGTAGVLSQPTNAIFPVKASENIPALSIVYFSGENSVGLASGNPATDPPRTPVGIVQTELSPGEMGILHQSGEISSDTWDWSAHIGKPLYCGDFGAIVTHRPAGLLAYRIGFVKSRTTIVFQVDAETQPQVYQAGPSDVVVSAVEPLTSAFSTNQLGERIWTLEMPAATGDNDGYMTGQQAYQLQLHGYRLTQAESDILNRAVIGHTHTLASLTDVDVTTPPPGTGSALIFNGTRWVPGSVDTTPALPTVSVPLGSVPSTFTLHSTQASMQHYSAYAATPTSIPGSSWSGVFNQATAHPAFTFPTPVDAAIPAVFNADISAITNTSHLEETPSIAEVVVNIAPTGPLVLYVGIVMVPPPFTNSSLWGNSAAVLVANPFETYTWSPLGPGLSGLPPLQAGDVIGMVYDPNLNRVTFFINGVSIGAIDAPAGPSAYIIVGASDLT